MTALFRWLRKYVLRLIILAVIFGVLIIVINSIRHSLDYWDDDPDRGATVIGMDQPDAMGDQFDKVVYPADQGWSAAESLWFYNTTQGSTMMPYDFFLALEQAKSDILFRDNANINGYRYLVQQATSSNPDGLPLGFVKDTYQGREYLGFTCAACHTGQVNYQGTAIRIDGGIPMADMVGFLHGLAKALNATVDDEAKFNRFADRVLAGNAYSDKEQIRKDLETYALRISLYNTINRSKNGAHRVNYGYGRLDAFGRIFNRTIEHLLTKEQLRDIINGLDGILPGQAEQIVADTNELLTAANREAINKRILETLQKNGKSKLGALRIFVKHLHENLYNPPNAPVSYPVIWDIPQHDYVQWNGIGENAGPGTLGRNVGEVIGVFGTLDWYLSDDCDLASRITGQCSLFGTPAKGQLIRFDTSVNKHNLVKMEEQLVTLKSPAWEDDHLKTILPPLNQAKVAEGRELFEQYCVACHHDIDRDDPYRKVVAYLDDIKAVGTDPQMALNSVNYQGKSGFLQNLYVEVNGGNLVMKETMPVAALLTIGAKGVVGTPDPDKSTVYAWFESLIDIGSAVTDNLAEESMKQGNYPLGSAKQPYNSLLAYKARPLNGVWASAPYLHNGSVPTLYDLLLPADQRPKTFLVGSREFDPVKVGFKSADYEHGFTFDTSLPGNGNQGHEYAAGVTPPVPGGKPLPALNHEERMALVEYMKSL